MRDAGLDKIELAEYELEQWLVTHAEAGVPELVLMGILYDYAELLEDLGYVPRMWSTSTR